MLLYGTVSYVKPAIMFNDDGSLRQFGIGYHKKTVFPAWLISIIIAILSYFAIMYYIAYPSIA